MMEVEQEEELKKHQNTIEILGFDPHNIIAGPPVYLRKQIYYQGFASTTFSIEQATNILDFIGKQVDSDDCLPFAVKLVENNELISVFEDNGEFACGAVLERCLKRLDGFNVLICVSRKVKGCFVSDMVQGQKLHAVKEAADRALELLHKHLTGSDLPGEEGGEVKISPGTNLVPPNYTSNDRSFRRKSVKK